MNVTEQARRLAADGNVSAAYDLLEREAAKDDGDAAWELGTWRMAGRIIRRDLGEARRWFGIAAVAGHAAARDTYIALLSNGAGGCGRDWPQALSMLEQSRSADAAQQLRLIAAMDLDEAGNPKSSETPESLHTSPRIGVIREFLSPDLCAFVRAKAMPMLRPSVVFDPRTGRSFEHPERRASAAPFPFMREGPVIHAINRRIAAATDTLCEQGEPIQMLSYGKGGEYRLHHDTSSQDPNPRIVTVLVYLNDEYEGGETYFPAIDYAFKGRTGDALIFHNVTEGSTADARATHAGRPVTSGRKLVLSKWIRANPLDLSGPPGRPL